MRTTPEERTYRNRVSPRGLLSFCVREKETDMLVSASPDTPDIMEKAASAVRRFRRQVEDYAAVDGSFRHSLCPVRASGSAPDIVKEMCEAAAAAGVGPMACVAGAIAQYAGMELLEGAEEVIIENGGDIFMKTKTSRNVGIYAGESAFGSRLSVEAPCGGFPAGICTSSGTVGHSLNFGSADAVVVFSRSAVLADAAATASSNLVKKQDDILRAIEFAASIEGVRGVLVVAGDKFGAWGEVRVRGS